MALDIRWYGIGYPVRLTPNIGAWAATGDDSGEVVGRGRRFLLVKLDRSRRTVAVLPEHAELDFCGEC